MLFRGPDVKKKISVLSGGERARLCLAGLLLSEHNVLILDEPGNHLDVESVESLAEALVEYKGTVIFTSHDRHFMRRVATSIVEVRDGRVVNYHGDYEAYLYAVNKEIEEGEREIATRMSKAPAEVLKAKAAPRPSLRSERELRKEMSNVEKTIARLDEQKKLSNSQFLSATDPKEAVRLHQEIEELARQLTAAEERWCVLQEELGE
jgi:ATP-binding cassette, subfamily F, member 3